MLPPDKVRGDVEFEHVRFGYDPDRIIINDFSATAKAGQKIAIVGPTGAGKTTMVNLLMRFYELNSGCIRIDGIPTSELTRENVHDLFCMVLQDTWLFDGTIRENVVYDKTDATQELIQRAMDKLTSGRTSFIIAHRLSTIRNADLILVMKDGDIIEKGKHEELLARGGFYADLYNSQFESA